MAGLIEAAPQLREQVRLAVDDLAVQAPEPEHRERQQCEEQMARPPLQQRVGVDHRQQHQPGVLGQGRQTREQRAEQQQAGATAIAAEHHRGHRSHSERGCGHVAHHIARHHHARAAQRDHAAVGEHPAHLSGELFHVAYPRHRLRTTGREGREVVVEQRRVAVAPKQ